MWLCEFDSYERSYMATGLTKEAALLCMRKLLNKSVELYGPFRFSPVESDFNFYEVLPGDCIMDGEVYRYVGGRYG